MGNSLRGHLGNLCGTQESKRALGESTGGRQPLPQPTAQEEEINESEPLVGQGSEPVKQTETETSKGKEEATSAPEGTLHDKDLSRSDSTSSKSSSFKKGLLNGLLHFSTPKFETLEIGELDQKFESAQNIFDLYIKDTQAFRTAITDFQKLHSKKDFEHAFLAHQRAIEAKENETKEDKQDPSEVSPLAKPDKASQSTELLTAARGQYESVKSSTSDTQGKLDNIIHDIDNINFKEHVRDEMADRSFVSRYSVSGRYSKNVKVLKKKRALLNAFCLDLNEWNKMTEPIETEAQMVKPDILGDVTELKESPGRSRRIKNERDEKGDGSEDKPEVSLSMDVTVSGSDNTGQKSDDQVEKVEGKVHEEVSKQEIASVESVPDEESVGHDDNILNVEKNESNTPESNQVKSEMAESEKDKPDKDASSHGELPQEGEILLPLELAPCTFETVANEQSEVEVPSYLKDNLPEENEKENVTVPDGAETSASEVTTREVIITHVSESDSIPPDSGRKEEKTTADQPSSPKNAEDDQLGSLPSTGPSKREPIPDIGEGKIVDYGSYLLLNDDQELIRRSRSLDSLTSRGSRASLSRMGSFEIVTNFEIKIAEQAEAEKMKSDNNEE